MDSVRRSGARQIGGIIHATPRARPLPYPWVPLALLPAVLFASDLRGAEPAASGRGPGSGSAALEIVKDDGVTEAVPGAAVVYRITVANRPRELFGLAYQGPDGPATLYAIDPATGAATAIGPVGFESCSGTVKIIGAV